MSGIGLLIIVNEVYVDRRMIVFSITSLVDPFSVIIYPHYSSLIDEFILSECEKKFGEFVLMSFYFVCHEQLWAGRKMDICSI